MENLDQELQALIKKSLPQQVGEELQKVLRQAKKDSDELAELKESNDRLSNRLNASNELNKELQGVISEHASLESKREDLEERERNLEITKLTLKLEESEKRANMVQEFTSGLVRNTLVRKSILDSESTDTPVTYGADGMQNGGGYKNVTKNYDETRKEE